jgi:PAS domain-containing protein
VTARRDAERELRERDARLAAVLEAARAGTFDVDLRDGGETTMR